MKSNIELSFTQKYETLKTLLIENIEDLKFWRERSWKFTYWMIGGFVTLSGLSFFVKNGGALSFVIGGLAIAGIIYLVKNYFSYSKRLEDRRQIEKALGFFEKGAYIDSESLFKIEQKTTKPSFWGTGAFIAMICIVAIGTIAAIILSKT